MNDKKVFFKNKQKMNKRTAIDSMEFQVLPNTKHARVSDGSVTNLLDDIQFMDFDDEFTTSEESIDEQQQQQPSINGMMSSATDSQQSNKLLDLTKWKRCTVERYERDARTKDLIIYGHEDPIRNNPNRKSTDDDSDGATVDAENLAMQCRLQHFWSQCRIEAGDVISIIAVWNVELQSYCVTNADGLVVVRPDFLVSGTTVVGGLFCMRKAVLQDRFKGIETGIKIVSCIWKNSDSSMKAKSF